MAAAPPCDSFPRKRKADSIGRLSSLSSSSGRGRTAGWTTCPLCASKKGRQNSKLPTKKFALGRGIAEHLHAIHAPWKVGDSPTEEERRAFDERVLEIIEQLERDAKSQPRGVDRNGNTARGYRDSIPEFLKAAADGDFERLKLHVNQARNAGTLRQLIDTSDRHNSTAIQWAAGGGHLECLKYLMNLCDELSEAGSHPSKRHKIRRREGKSSLHYACRNGRLVCVRYLIEERNCNINETSGDGTTPFHMACFGGHKHVVEYLIANEADTNAKNDWKCSAAHWVAMSKSDDQASLWGICDLLQQNGVVFTERQNQGHTALHKAAQKNNKHFIQWLIASDPSDEQWKLLGHQDEGGHIPSEIAAANCNAEISEKLKELGC